MDWKMIFSQIIIALITTSLGSILTYLKAKNEIDTKLEETKIIAENEIKKIQETSKSEIEKIKTETEAKIKEAQTNNELISKTQTATMQNELAKEFIQELINNPEEADKKIQAIEKLSKKFSNNNNRRKKR